MIETSGLAATGLNAAATCDLRRAGYHVRLSRLPFSQPLGSRSFRQFWSRQVRWAKLRHATFPTSYYPEIFAGSTVPLLAVTLGCWVSGSNALVGVITMAALWFGSEVALCRWIGWHFSARTPFAVITRDILIPIIWIAGLTGKDFEWQGHQMSARREDTPATIG